MMPFKNIEGKGENAGNQHFLFFPQWVLPIPKGISAFELQSFCRLQMLPIWTSRKICCLVDDKIKVTEKLKFLLKSLPHNPDF